MKKEELYDRLLLKLFINDMFSEHTAKILINLTDQLLFNDAYNLVMALAYIIEGFDMEQWLKENTIRDS